MNEGVGARAGDADLLGPDAVRVAGGLAVAGGVANAVADFLLRGGPSPRPGSAFTLESLGEVPFDLIFAGSVLGAVAIPLWIFGLLPVYRALEPAGRRTALVLVILFAYGITVAAGYHGAYVFYGVGYEVAGTVSEEARPVVAEMNERFRQVHDALLMAFVPPWMLASLGFVAVVLRGRTRYARWMVVLSPILVPITAPLGQALPAPFGGYIRPILGTTIWTAFFLMSTIVAWRPVSEASRETAPSE